MKPNNSPEFAALIGLDWGDKSHAVAVEPAGGSTETSTLEHSAESLHHWLDQLEQRFGARQVALAIAQDFAQHPEKAFFSELPGAGPTLAPRLLAAFGTLREQYPEAASMQRYFGVAPLTEKSGARAWIHWRWKAPTFTRQTLVEWAGQTIVLCPWAKAYYERQRAKGSTHHATLRALAFKWLRVLWRCWQKREPYKEELFLRQLEKRRSPIAARARQLAITMAN